MLLHLRGSSNFFFEKFLFSVTKPSISFFARKLPKNEITLIRITGAKAPTSQRRVKSARHRHMQSNQQRLLLLLMGQLLRWEQVQARTQGVLRKTVANRWSKKAKREKVLHTVESKRAKPNRLMPKLHSQQKRLSHSKMALSRRRRAAANLMK